MSKEGRKVGLVEQLMSPGRVAGPIRQVTCHSIQAQHGPKLPE